MKYGVFFITFCFSVFADARALSLVYKNNIAVVKYKFQKHQEALDQFIGLTAQDPNDLVIKLNMAATLNSLGESEKSAQLNTTLLRDIEAQLKTSVDKDEQQELLNIKFAALFNRGVAYQVMKNIDKALESYQEALSLIQDTDDPKSPVKQIKTNIELMFAKGGGGKGKDKNKDKQQGEGEGEGDPNESEGEGEQDKKEKPQDQENKDQQKKQPKEFDQKYMSNEDLKRIMEELKDQEQKIRAKMERKGGKNGNGKNEKEW